MKYLKLFENHKNEEDIHRICNEYDIKNYTINDDLSIDVDGDVFIIRKNMIKLPLKFNKVNGILSLSYTNLKKLEGAPKEVNGNFYCIKNVLTSLKDSPKNVKGDFNCSKNELISLEGAPDVVRGDFNCSHNKLYSFYNLPISIDGHVYYDDNPIECFYNILGTDPDLIYEFNELYVIQKVEGEWSIYKHRMEEFVDMFETEQPNYKEIEKYYKILE
jgi:hypothetical protein